MSGKKVTIAVLSGKGGAGKTLAAVNMAAVAGKAVYLDCDVEEPNGHLFFKPEKLARKNVSVKIPVVDANKCDGCRVCLNFCKFNAMALINGQVKIFDDVCHPCGGCLLLCPQKAIFEEVKIIGELVEGLSGEVSVVSGIMTPGVESGTPIIKELLTKIDSKQGETVIIDCPPGSSCLVMESIKEADYCLLVAEPTIYGSHNLAMVYELVKLFNKPHGVLLNKCLDFENPSETFCRENEIGILGRLPFDQELGAMNSRGMILARSQKKYWNFFHELLEQIKQEAHGEATVDSQR